MFIVVSHVQSFDLSFSPPPLSCDLSNRSDELPLGPQGVEASVDGVLGGYGHVNEADIKCSEPFLKALLAERFSGANKDRHLVALGTLSLSLVIRKLMRLRNPPLAIFFQYCFYQRQDCENQA